MLRIVNLTPFETDRAVLVDQHAHQVWVVIVKATFDLTDSGVRLSDTQEPVCAAPKYVGAPGASSLVRDIEFVTDHPGTDITVNASAHAPREKAVPRLAVQVTVGPITKSLEVVGDRAHRGWLAKSPEPFVRMPIRYERASGGRTGPRDLDRDPRNPIGRGRPAGDGSEVPLLPNIYARGPGAKETDPDGFGAIPASWSPRRELAGTFDDDWRSNRMPLWPHDFDPRYYLSAPAGLVAPRHLRGGERVELVNLSPHGTWDFKLPHYHIPTETFLGGHRFRRIAQLDRVIIEPDERRLIMVWRASLRCGVRCREIDRTIVEFKPVVTL